MAGAVHCVDAVDFADFVTQRSIPITCKSVSHSVYFFYVTITMPYLAVTFTASN